MNKHQREIPEEYRKGRTIPSPDPQGQKKSTNYQKPLLSFELFDFNHQCPSKWKNDEIKSLFQTFNKMCLRTWMQVIGTGGKSGTKTGLGFTEIVPDPFKRPIALSPDLPISELRVNKKARIFGSRHQQIYYVLRLDRNHQVCKSN